MRISSAPLIKKMGEVEYKTIVNRELTEGSAAIRERVEKARSNQRAFDACSGVLKEAAISHGQCAPIRQP